jgi:predicted amidophosphoribosyltransferase
VLATALAACARVPVVDALALTRADAPLSFGADKAERAAKVSGRFRARASFAGRAVLLVDDVRTTGATLAEAARVLGEAGAEVTTAAFAVAL